MPLLCGFSKCKWTTVGKVKDAPVGVNAGGLVVKEEWRVVSENKQYTTIIPDCALWSSFKVIAKELEETKFCVVCMNGITSEGLQTVQCGHSYHRLCLRRVKSACLQCFGRQMMTNSRTIYSHDSR